MRRLFARSGTKEVAGIFGLFVLFLFVRMPLLNFIYHQDEHKWARIVNPAFGLQGESVHPPFTEITFHYFGELFGYDHLRWLILLFAAACFWMIFKIAREQYNKQAAWWSLLLFAIIPYSVIASIQIDIDGAILPFWILLTFWSLTRLDWRSLKTSKAARWWLVLLGIGILGGLLTKLSFVLIFPGALMYLWRCYQPKVNYKLFEKVLVWFTGIIIIFSAILVIFHLIYPELSPIRFLQYTTHFSALNFLSRDYAQMAYLVTKSILLLSPLLLLLLIHCGQTWRRHEFWWWYISFGLLFYLVIFDFSNRTIDRYMMFLILPLVFIGGERLARFWEQTRLTFGPRVLASSLLVGGLFWLIIGSWLILSYNKILPLVPKSAYVAQLKNLDFSFVLPFSSGSGPLGFYMSAKFIVVFWCLAILLTVVWYWSRAARWQVIVKMLFLSSAVVYCLWFNLELATGLAYGSPDKVARAVLATAVNDDSIDKVITYNDAGTYELDSAGKYQARFYTQPIFAEGTRGKMKQWQGDYVVIDFPEINKQSVFWQYLQSCGTVFQSVDKRVNGYIFNCHGGDTSILN